MAIEVFLSSVRGSFLKLGEPEEYKPGDGRPRWSAAGMVLKSDTDQIKKVNAAIKAAALEKWGPKADLNLKGILVDKNKCCWQDGDNSSIENYAGHWIINTHRGADKGRPIVYDNDKSPIYQLDNTVYPGKGGRIFSGCYLNLHFELWAQDNTHGKGMRATLLGVQRVKAGDAFGGGSAPSADAFGEVSEGADAEDIS